MDGTEPSAASEEYKNGINLKQNNTLKVKAFLDNMESRTVTVKFEITDLLKPKYKFKYSKKYAAGGNYALIDGVEGGDEFSKNWQGFEGEDLDVIIDLGKEKDIKSVNTSTIQHQGHWIFHPKNITIFTSKDGKKFKEIKTPTTPVEILLDKPKSLVIYPSHMKIRNPDFNIYPIFNDKTAP